MSKFSGRASVSSSHSRTEVGVEAGLFGKTCGVGAKFAPGDERDIVLSLCVPFLFYIYLSICHPWARAIGTWIKKRWKMERASDYEAVVFSLRVFDWALWWEIAHPDHSWYSKTPWWRHGTWRPLGFHQVQRSELLEKRRVLVPMPEGTYEGEAQLERLWVGFTRLPRRFDKVVLRFDLTLSEGEAIPEPSRKNSDNKLYSISMPADSIEDGIGKVVGGVLASRLKWGR